MARTKKENGSSSTSTAIRGFSADFKAVPPEYRTVIPEYIKDYVSLNQFAA